MVIEGDANDYRITRSTEMERHDILSVDPTWDPRKKNTNFDDLFWIILNLFYVK